MEVVNQQHVVEQLSSYAAHESLRDCIHIRRAHRRPDHLRADALGRAVECRAELVISIPQQDGGSVPVHGGVAQLLGRPRLRRVAGRGDMDHPPRCEVYEEERVDLAEQEVMGLDEVADPHAFGMILQERRPTLAAATAAANTAHVLLGRPLADLDPDLEQFAADTLGTPQLSSRRHVADEVDRLRCQWRRLPRPRSPPPEQAEAGTMPAQNGLRLDDGDRATPRRQHARADEQLQPVHEMELRALGAAPRNVDLVAEDGVLDDQL
jgi:hypothetical protein